MPGDVTPGNGAGGGAKLTRLLSELTKQAEHVYLILSGRREGFGGLGVDAVAFRRAILNAREHLSATEVLAGVPRPAWWRDANGAHLRVDGRATYSVRRLRSAGWEVLVNGTRIFQAATLKLAKTEVEKDIARTAVLNAAGQAADGGAA
jgi:hypothetical protein